MDRLSLLPNELLDDIFDLAHSPTHPLTGPLSKRILPFFHRSFYRDILLSSYEQLGLLYGTCQTRTDLASLVFALRLEIPTTKDAEGDSVETEDPNFPSNDAIVGLLSQLLHLHKLRIRGSSRLVALLLAPPDNREFPFCSKLRVLQLAASFDSHPDPFQFIMLSTLHQYQSLVTLTLDICRSDSSIEPGVVHAEIDNPLHLLPELCSLSCLGPIGASPFAQRIVGSAPGMIDLVLLIFASSSSAIRELLNSVVHPEHLEALKLAISGGAAVSSEILEPLKLFTDLKSLSLNIPASFEDIVPAISQAPLFFLNLGWLCTVQLTALTGIISGTTKIETLAILKLDTVKASRGKPIPRDMVQDELSELDLDTLGWNLPDWYDSFDRDEFKVFLELAEKEEVVVLGKAVDALEIEDEWEEEIKYYRSVVGT